MLGSLVRDGLGDLGDAESIISTVGQQVQGVVGSVRDAKAQAIQDIVVTIVGGTIAIMIAATILKER